MSRRFRPLVLCYHAVSSGWEHPLAVTLPAFERQLRILLRRRYRPTPIEEIPAGRARALHVTFDDGFRSVKHAVPVLERFGVPATVFVCPSLADDGGFFPVSELGNGAGARASERATMTWDELGELHNRGITIGSHTLSHPHLPELPDADLLTELRDSKAAIEARLGGRCRYLAYPYGDHDERVRKAARVAGYDAAFALPGRDRPVDAYALPRVGLWRSEGRLRVELKTSIARPTSPILQRALSRR